MPNFKTGLLTVCFGIAASLISYGSNSWAHTISVGTFNAGTPGSVTVVLGSYHASGAPEGSLQLIAGPSAPSAVVNFSNLVLIKPTELVDGVNNFFAPMNFGLDPAGTFNLPTDTTTSGPVVRWQSVTFDGLAAGIYDYQVSGMNTDIWEDWSSLTNNWQGTLVITGTAVGGPQIPEPGTLALFGLGLAGIGYARRKRAV